MSGVSLFIYRGGRGQNEQFDENDEQQRTILYRSMMDTNQRKTLFLMQLI